MIHEILIDQKHNLGMVLYQIFTQIEPFSKEPYTSMEYFELREWVSKNNRIELPPEVPQFAVQIINQCWHSGQNRDTIFKKN